MSIKNSSLGQSPLTTKNESILFSKYVFIILSTSVLSLSQLVMCATISELENFLKISTALIISLFLENPAPSVKDTKAGLKFANSFTDFHMNHIPSHF